MDVTKNNGEETAPESSPGSTKDCIAPQKSPFDPGDAKTPSQLDPAPAEISDEVLRAKVLTLEARVDALCTTLNLNV